MYTLYYWSGIQGRGEMVRLALEQSGVRYSDVAKQEDGDDRLMRFLLNQRIATPPFAPPFLLHGKRIVAQTAAILMYLGSRHALAPKDGAGRIWTHQIQLTIADFLAEAHDTHHPISVALYYADQKSEAKRRAVSFRKERVPKFMRWFESVIARNPKKSGFLVGRRVTYADLSLFQTVRWLEYGFPRLMKRVMKEHPKVARLAASVGELPRVAAYLASDRRLAFNDDDLLRHYPELDDR